MGEQSRMSQVVQCVLDNVCDKDSGLSNEDLVAFLEEFATLAVHLVKDPANPRYRAINATPGTSLFQRLSRWPAGKLCVYMLGYENARRVSADDNTVLRLSGRVSPDALGAIHEAIVHTQRVIKGESRPASPDDNPIQALMGLLDLLRDVGGDD